MISPGCPSRASPSWWLDQAAHPPFGTNLTYPLDRYVRVHQTSGTSGAPLRWLDTQESWDWWARCWGFVLRGAGLGAQDRVFFPFSFGLFVGFWAGFEGARAIGALVIPGGGQDSAQRLAAIEALGATAICCTPSYALHLAEEARARGLDLNKLGVRTTVHAGEPGAGIPSVRARIEEAWGARAFDHAGMTEMGAYGFECADQAGLHVNESEFIAEVIDPATGQSAEEGELVLSNLGRAGSPLLRYLTGDRVRVAGGPCACGRTFLRLAGGILGRVDDMLIVRGVNVFPSALEGIVRRFPAVDEFLIEVVPAERDGRSAAPRRGEWRRPVVGRAVGAGGRARRPRHPRRGGARAGRQPAALRAEGPPPRPPHRSDCTLGLTLTRVAGSPEC